VWGSDYVGDTKTLDVHVKRLRAKIEPDPADPPGIVDHHAASLQVRTRDVRQLGLDHSADVPSGLRRTIAAGGRCMPGLYLTAPPGRCSASFA
jgi:hypothetical protein